ncbi:hypothetical protein ACH495_07595 [Micromonospora sp. NPDC018662]|uniref:hypothetical protein n=1 Tax=Micromonospora sp. NPDC018662 TaxID=3364238 RepID=UPI0037959CF7
MTELKPGVLLLVGRAAGVQFVRPFHFRLIRVLDWSAYDGWTWLDGYQLDEQGDAVSRRSIFVKRCGLSAVSTSPQRIRVLGMRPVPASRPHRPARERTGRRTG